MKILNKTVYKAIFLVGLFLYSLLLFTNISAKALDKEDVPEPLKPWVNWALFNQDTQNCSPAYNNSQLFCAWPSALQLELDNKQGSFKQHWKVQAETWVTLPGNAQQWPHDVMINGFPAVVVSHGPRAFPSIKLPIGEHDISGKFLWDSLPETLTIPPTTGLIKISRNGQVMDFPRINQQGQLWLDKSLQEKSVQDALDVQVYRKVDDGHPMRIQTRLILRVSGRSRDVSFAKIQLAGFIPLKLESQLPTRINQQGNLQVQIRPGNWQIDLTSYKPGIISELSLAERDDNLPKQEVWVFKSNPSLRLTEISGVPAVDSRQTRLPKEWQSLPAYLLDVKKQMKLKTLQRGSASPEPNRLTLQRSMWMDFDGKGYTVQDQIKGTMTRDWRLVSSPELQLGSARMDGDPQFITTLKNGEDKGVEVRRGKINLEAASRFTESLSQLPVSAWKHDFQRVNTTLFLAPGWKLFSAYGADNLPRTWLQSWTLLDLFLVLIIGVSIARLWDWKWGLFAALTMALIWHEPGAPKYIWLNLIAAIALLRVLPKGVIKNLVWGYRNITLLALLLIIIPFTVNEVRNGLYPQLGLYSNYDSVVSNTTYYDYSDNTRYYDNNDMIMEESMVVMPTSTVSRSVSKGMKKKWSKKEAYRQKNTMQSANQMVDPNANIQTGPGLPTWNWKRVNFSWNSPVNQNQKLELSLISPRTNLVLNFLRVLLLLILIARLLQAISFNNKSGGLLASLKLPFKSSLPKFFKGGNVKRANVKGASAVLLPLLVLMLLSPISNVIAEGKKATLVPSLPSNDKSFPDKALLQTLQQRLMAKADCLPNCAQIEAMRLELSEQELRVYLQVHSADDVAIPLPGNSDQWRAEQVLLENQPAQSLFRDNSGVLWLGLKQGINHVVMQGRLPKQPQVQLALPLPPKYVNWKGEGWTVEGIRENHIPAQQIQLVRTQKKNAKNTIADLSSDQNYLPPLLHVERILHLGLDWFIDTRVTRLSPVGTPLSMKIPLLKGESVLSNAYTVKKGKALVNMSSTQSSIHWQSQIPVGDTLSLVATQESGLIESWKLDISPIWHVAISGIPEIHHGNQSSVWLPKWQPWPGEKVELKITRPQGIAGRTLTIERSVLSTKVGKRLRESELTLKVRSSRGGQHPILLPENAELVTVYINGKLQPVRQQKRTVSLPIVPGEQTISLKWRTDKPVSSMVTMLPVNVGVDSVNNSMHLALSRDRWILFANGPTMGPAVLFWGVLLVILLGSIILGYIKNSPLKAWQWFLLGTGLSLATPIMIVIVVGWLLALSYRPRLKEIENRLIFNAAQVLLLFWTLIAFISLFFALQQGLLGWPDMQIKGNGSNTWMLRWYQDRALADLPQPWVLSVPLFIYRILMLLWALWLAFSLISWLKMGWQNFSDGGLWRKGKKRVKKVHVSDNKLS